MVNAKLKINCPPMAVRYVSAGLSMTDELSCPSTLIFDDGTPTWAGIITFPKTPVKKQADLLHWMVNPCVADNNGYKSVEIELDVPEEPCEIKFNFWPHDSKLPFVYMLAHKVIANVAVVLHDGRMGKGTATLPDAISQWTPTEGMQTWVVEAVVVEGIITFPSSPQKSWFQDMLDFIGFR